MAKINCWEFKKCGRQPGGTNVAKEGICPASVERRTNGIHGGRNGGRCCWAILATQCSGGNVKANFCCKAEYLHQMRIL